MSFTKDVKNEIINKCFTSKKKHSKIQNDRERAKDVEEISDFFLRFGTVCDPQKMYLLEFVLPGTEDAERIRQLLTRHADFGDAFKIAERKGSTILYVQDADAISDFLNLTGAHNSLLHFENMRILKEMRGNIQRTVNCETANIRRTIDASVKQIADIEYIEEEIGLENIPDALREMAEVRLAKPDASLKELSESLVPPIGKSGVNHRLRKLSSIAEEHKKTVHKELFIK